MGQHETSRKPGDPYYNDKWSGVSHAPHCGCVCSECGEKLHIEGDTHYCPRCDDFKAGVDHSDDFKEE